MTAAPLLEVKNLTVSYRNSPIPDPVVNGVSFRVAPGSVLGIIGESGAGKSTLALALLGLHDSRDVAVHGEVAFQGRNLLAMKETELCAIRGAGIGMVFQDPSGALDPVMRVADQVAEPIRLHEGLDRKEALRASLMRLAEVGISEDVLAVAPYPHQLSGGLRQRAMLAAALACDPALLIADEPTSSLDVTLQAHIIALLNARRLASGMPIVFITHDLALAATFADELLVLHRGEAVEHGTCNEVLSNPQHAYTAGLVAAWATGKYEGS